MHFTVHKDVLSKALKLIAGVIERRQSNFLPILSNVLIKVKDNQAFFTGTDQEVQIFCWITLHETFKEGDMVHTRLTRMRVTKNVPSVSKRHVLLLKQTNHTCKAILAENKLGAFTSR